MRQLAFRKDATVDEFTCTHADPAALHIAAGDAVIEHQSVSGKQALDDPEIVLQMTQTHVLEHANAGDPVVGLHFVQIAVVAQQDLTAILQAAALDLLAGVLELLARQGDASGARAIVLRCAPDQRAPAAANIQKALTRRQPQLAQNVIEFLRLRDFQCIVRVSKIGTGVHHLGVQEQGVEVVRNIVVVLDCSAITIAAVTGQPA